MMRPVNLFFYSTVIGMVGIVDNGEAITDLFFCRNDCNEYGETELDKEALLLREPKSSIGKMSASMVMKESREYDFLPGEYWQIVGKASEKSIVIKETDLLKEAAAQLNEYFNGVRKSFKLPLSPAGTSFQMAVWNALLEIPYGETRSYGNIAMAVGKPKASRAVGMACNRNKIAILIPCHRVIGADGKLVGFGGGIGVKQKLLDIEGYCRKPGSGM